jgi:hypothetical protein
LSASNALVDSSAWIQATQTQDLLVQAVVCNENNDRDNADNNGGSEIPLSSLLDACFSKEEDTNQSRPIMSARGIAKLFRLSQQPEKNGETSSDESMIIIRAPVTLPLEY